MKTILILVAMIFAAGISFTAYSKNMDEAICSQKNISFTCTATNIHLIPSKACNDAREIAMEGCLKEGINCSIVDKISRLSNGKYKCRAVAIGQSI